MVEIKDYGQLYEEYFNFSYNEPIKEKDKLILEKKLSKLRQKNKITHYNHTLFHAFVLNDHGKEIIDSHIPEILMRRIYAFPRKFERLAGRDDVWIEIQDSLAETYKLLEEIDAND